MEEVLNHVYVHSDMLVTTDWVYDHLQDPGVRIVESNEDLLLYPSKHIPGSVQIDWTTDLNDQMIRDYVSRENFERLMSAKGIENDTTVIFYGDKNNWWACYAFWVFQLFGHTKSAVMDGGRLKWEKENRPMTKEVPRLARTNYKAPPRNDHSIRAFRDDVMEHIKRNMPLVDVRSPEEYTGKRLHMPDYPNEGALRGGHIPGAVSIPWAKAINPEDGTFKTFDELKKLYEIDNNLNPDDNVIAYCRIGERSSHTWFVLTYLLGFNHVRNYDGSWTEWGNMVGVPIEK